jgi:phage FluMu protein Com
MPLSARSDPWGSAHALVPDPGPAEGAPHDCRCGCGSLLARLRPDGVELKCRRCKRVVTLTFAELSTGEVGAPRSIC